MTTIKVHLGKRSYPILVGKGALSRVGALARRVSRYSGVFAVSSQKVKRLYGGMVERACRASGVAPAWLLVPDGEGAKTLAVLGRLLRSLAASGASRDSCVIALGGGTVGDVAGFAAAVYARGIPVIQVPTTLLAQVDAAIGGKTGVDLPEGKNLAGSFHHPIAVLADTSVLATLPVRQFRSGLAEVVKYGVIRSPRLFSFLEKNTDSVLGRNPGVLGRLVSGCAAIKADVVSRDERESGLRLTLNFGHTIGHAIEAVSGYRILHGEAVSIGMVAAARISAGLGLCSPAVPGRLGRLLGRLGLPVDLPRGLSRVKMLKVMMRDKKKMGNRLRFVLTRSIGDVTVSDGVKQSEIFGMLAERGGNIS